MILGAEDKGYWRGRAHARAARELIHSPHFETLRSQADALLERTWRVIRYQRVIDPRNASYPVAQPSFIHPRTFERHLDYLASNCAVVPLDDLAERVAAGDRIPERTVAMTFDGGWVDTFAYALPLLYKYRIPATVFVPGALVGTNQYLWPEKVLLAMLVMRNAGVTFEPFTFFGDEVRESLEQTSPGGVVTLPLIYLVVEALRERSAVERWIALRVFGAIAGSLGADEPIEPAFMNWDEVRVMSRAGVTFGSLGQSHLSFTDLSRDEAIEEIRAGAAALADEVSAPSRVFAFPEGQIGLHGSKALHEAGFRFGTGIGELPGAKPAIGEPLIVPRVAMHEGFAYTAELFACRLWGLL